MASKAPLLIMQSAADSVADDPDYREGVLESAEQQGIRKVKLNIRDKETGQQTSISTKHISGMWGANKSYLNPETYEELTSSPPDSVDTAARAEALLDTRDSGLRFYYHAPQASHDPRTAQPSD